MNCKEFKSRIDAYIDGELSAEESAAMHRHAQECEDCNDELKFAKMLGSVLSEAADEIVPPLPAQAAWRNAVREESRRRKISAGIRRMGAVAAALAVMVGGFAVLRAQGIIGSDPASSAANEPGVVYIAVDGGENSKARTAEAADVAAASGKSATVRLISQDVDAAAASAEALIDDFGGTVADMSVSDSSAFITAGIPCGELDSFMESLEFIGDADEPRITGEGEGDIIISLTIKSE